MSKQNQTEWRCPYCDGLNDWQDEVCQICGDGRREEAVSQTETKNVSSEAQKSRMEYQAQSQNTYSQQTTKKKTEPEVRRPEPEIRRTETEVKIPVSEVPVEEPKKKKHKAGRIIGTAVLAAVVLTAGAYLFGIHKADKLVENLDFQMLEEAPCSSLEDFRSWAENKGYEVTSGKDMKSFFSGYSVNPGKSDWDITVSEGSHGIEIQYKADGQNLHEVYKKLERAMVEQKWGYCLDSSIDPGWSEGITGKKYAGVNHWWDENNNWYEIALKDREITVTRLDQPTDSQGMVSELDLDFLKNIPEDLNAENAEKWLNKNNCPYIVTGDENIKVYHAEFPQSPDWNVSLHGSTGGNGVSVVYNAMPKDCKDLSALYESLAAKLESSGFAKVCQEAAGENETDGSSRRLTIWQDQAGNLYDLSIKIMSYENWSEVNLVRENRQDHSSDAVNYDLTESQNQLNMAALAKMPMDSYTKDENWEQKFKENYGDSYYQPMDMAKGDSYCRVYFRYEPSSLENKKEILTYLKNQIQDATGCKMQLQYATMGDIGLGYEYYTDTEHGRISLSSGDSAAYVMVRVESKDD